MKQTQNLPEIKINELLAEDAALVEEARAAITLAYAPYSNFKVGAAVLLENGEVIMGANQENASYPCGICAERSTIATAQNLYPGVPIVAIALAAKTPDNTFTKDYVTPCGMCRQVIAECEKRYKRHVRIIMTSETKAIVADTINAILPLSFS